jgi:hypothetical protein
MSNRELITHLLYIESGGNPEIFKDVIRQAIDEINTLEKIREIVTRAVKSQDPINLYKALSINEIARLLNIPVELEKKEDSNEQITIDDIL